MLKNVSGTGVRLMAVACIFALTGGCQDFVIGGTKIKQDNTSLKKENVELRSTLDTTRQALETSQGQTAKLVEDLATAKTELSTKPATVVKSTGSATVRIPISGDVLFASGSVDLKSSAKPALDAVAARLNSEFSGNPVRVEGHTDSDPIRRSKWGSNQELSLQRAMSVERYLASKGVDGSRLSSVGIGSAKPRTSNTTAAGKAQNRRVEIVVVTE